MSTKQNKTILKKVGGDTVAITERGGELTALMRKGCWN